LADFLISQFLLGENMQRNILLGLITFITVIIVFYFSEVIGEIIVNDSGLIKISLMGSFVLGIIYSVILDKLGIYKD